MYKVYKIVSKKEVNSVYIGSTKAKLRQRLSNHMTDTVYSPNGKKNMWLKRNKGHLDIIQISTADNKASALYAEENEILKHIAEGYTVLNTLLPTNNKRIDPSVNFPGAGRAKRSRVM